MRKRDFLLVVLILVSIAMIPWLDGYLVRAHYLAFIAKQNADNPKIKINVIDYSMGWIGSSVTLHIAPATVKQTSDKNTLSAFVTTIEQEISHGPYLYDDLNKRWTFALADIKSNVIFPSYLSSFMIKQSEQNDVRADTLLGFFGNSTTHVAIPIFHFKLAPGLPKITWNGMNGDIVLAVEDNLIQQITASFTIRAIKIEGEIGLTTNDAVVTYDLSYQPIGLWNGVYHMTIPSVIISDAAGVRAVFKDIHLDKKLGVSNKNLYDVNTRLSFANGIVTDLLINSFLANFSIDNVDTKGILNLIHVPPKSPEEVNLGLSALISPTTALNTNIALNTSLGNLHVTGQAYWPKEIPLPKTFNTIQAHYNAKLDARVSIVLLNKLIELLYGAKSQNSNTVSPAQIIAQPSEQAVLKQIDVWKDQHLVALDIALQLQDLVKRKLANDIFAKNIDRYVLMKEVSENVATQLKAEYAALYSHVNNPAPVSASSPVAQQPLSSADMIYKKIDEWIKQGIIKQDGDSYVLSIIRK
jgi:hypothetical protein